MNKLGEMEFVFFFLTPFVELFVESLFVEFSTDQ